MKRTEVKFKDVKVGDTLYIKSADVGYDKCNQRTCKVVGFGDQREFLCADFGEGFYGHDAKGLVKGRTGYMLWKHDQKYFTLFKIEEEEETIGENHESCRAGR